MPNEEKGLYTIGELARHVGITVRTLQYYDKEHLLASTPTAGGRRMYTREDIVKLQQILFYKSLGFSLGQIREKILKRGSSPELCDIFSEQRDMLRAQIESQNKIADLLDLMAEETKVGKELSLDRLMAILHLMKEGNPYTYFVRSFNDEQLQAITKRFTSPDNYEGIMANIQELFSQLCGLYLQGADPAGEEGQQLARRWWDMVADFSKGDPAMLETLVSTGRDVDNWPEELRHLQEPIKNFLSQALAIYLSGIGIHLDDMEAKEHD